MISFSSVTVAILASIGVLISADWLGSPELRSDFYHHRLALATLIISQGQYQTNPQQE